MSALYGIKRRGIGRQMSGPVQHEREMLTRSDSQEVTIDNGWTDHVATTADGDRAEPDAKVTSDQIASVTCLDEQDAVSSLDANEPPVTTDDMVVKAAVVTSDQGAGHYEQGGADRTSPDDLGGDGRTDLPVEDAEIAPATSLISDGVTSDPEDDGTHPDDESLVTNWDFKLNPDRPFEVKSCGCVLPKWQNVDWRDMENGHRYLFVVGYGRSPQGKRTKRRKYGHYYTHKGLQRYMKGEYGEEIQQLQPKSASKDGTIPNHRVRGRK